MLLYQILKQTVSGKPQFFPVGSKLPIDTSHKDHYTSLFYYTPEQKAQVEKAGTLSVVKETQTSRLYFDFDSKEDLELARKDCLNLAIKLVNDYNVPQEAIQTAFTGNKGFSLELALDRVISNAEFKAAVMSLGNEYKTFDRTINDANRIVSVIDTKHRSSGLYKISLHLDELETCSIEEIKGMAKEPRGSHYKHPKVSLPKELFLTKAEKATPVEKDWDLQKLLESKPRHFKDYKYALLQGWFENGERHNALMVIAATCRGLGYDRDLTIKMCESAIEKQAERTGAEPFDLEELVDNIIDRSVFSSTWTGGQYSPENNPWLKAYCERMGFKVEDENKKSVVSIEDTFGFFKTYAENIDNLTVKTGIPALDKRLRMTVGMSVGIVAPPSVGKTSIALQMLNNMSIAGHRAIFFSYDMYKNHVYQKLVQKHLNLSEEEVFEIFRNGNQEQLDEINKEIKTQYDKVGFCFESGQKIDDISRSIKEAEEKTGDKVKFVVVDYNELIVTDNSDSTGSSSFVAQKLREIAITHQLCVLSLFQPSKSTGSPSDEILSYRAAKGSSAIEQSVSIMLGMSRPGFDPHRPEDDKFITINCLKNRMGKIFSLDLHWDGMQGTVRELTEEERDHLQEVRRRRAEEKESKEAAWS